MKKVFASALFAAVLFVAAQARAQSKDTSSFTHKVSKTATKVGDKTSELAVKGASTIVDKEYKDKSGPHGEKIYINNHSQYYFVNKKGHKVYLKESELKDKKM